MMEIYMDYAATTPVHPDVFKAMEPYFKERYGNPSSLHYKGQEARQAIEQAREQIAQGIGATPEEIIFTGCATEANNMALIGIAYANMDKGDHIITSTIEHHAVLGPAQWLEKRNFRVTYVPVDSTSLVDPDDIKKALTDKTILISIMHANNEVGTIEPIAEIGALAKERGIYFHTDAVQTVGLLDVNVDQLNVDLLSIAAHKIYGPKGVGALYVRKGTVIEAFLHGGEQEKYRRGGTENVPGIVGFGKAMEIARLTKTEERERLRALRDKLIQGAKSSIDGVQLTGHPVLRLPNHASFCFADCDGESVLLQLSLQGIAASMGSACTSGSLEPSHVLLAMGIPPELARGALRLTLGKWTEAQHIDYLLERLPQIVSSVRSLM